MKVAVTEYLNTYPLIWYFEQSQNQSTNEMPDIVKASPAQCALMLMGNEAQCGVVPVAAFPINQDFIMLLNPCVASRNKVGTVKLYLPKDIREIDEIMIDDASKTSVVLLKILLHYKYKNPDARFVKYSFTDIESINNKTGYMLIGDKNFKLKQKFPFEYDLAYEWVDWIKLPFIFATWMLRDKSGAQRTAGIIKKAYRLAKANFDQMCLDASVQWNMPVETVKYYFTENLTYEVGLEGIKSIRLFFEMASSLELLPKVEHYNFIDV
jgi:predicted solute-binding protein